MNLRREAIETLFPDQPGPNTYRLDALLDWLDTNAEQIAETTFTIPTTEHTERGRPHVLTVEAEIRVLTAVLRGNT